MVPPQSGPSTTHQDSNGNNYRYPPLVPPASLAQIASHSFGVGPDITVSEAAIRGPQFSTNLLSSAYQGRPTSISPVVNKPSPPALPIKPDGDAGSKE